MGYESSKKAYAICPIYLVKIFTTKTEESSQMIQ